MRWDLFWDRYCTLRGCGWQPSTLEHAITAGRKVSGCTLVQTLDALWSARLSRCLLLSHRRATAASYARRLQAGLNWGHAAGLCPSVRLCVPAGRPAGKGFPLTDGTVARMLRTARSYPGLPRIVRGLYHSGLRLTELLRLRYGPGPFSVVEGPVGLFHLSLPSETKGGRPAFLPTTAGFAALCNPAGAGQVFPAAVSPKTISRRISSLGATAHDLRRTFALRMAEAGLSEAEVGYLMRHRNVATTRNYYQRIEAERLGLRLRRLAG